MRWESKFWAKRTRRASPQLSPLLLLPPRALLPFVFIWFSSSFPPSMERRVDKLDLSETMKWMWTNNRCLELINLLPNKPPSMSPSIFHHFWLLPHLVNTPLSLPSIFYAIGIKDKIQATPILFPGHKNDTIHAGVPFLLSPTTILLLNLKGNRRFIFCPFPFWNSVPAFSKWIFKNLRI